MERKAHVRCAILIVSILNEDAWPVSKISGHTTVYSWGQCIVVGTAEYHKCEVHSTTDDGL